jgi:hypothetical protein
MTTTYIKNKKHIYNWVENHREHYRELTRKHKAKYDNWKKIQKIYLRILLD